MANVGVESPSAWNLNLRRNLNDMKTIEWANLAHLLSHFRLQSSADYWMWPLDSSKIFTVKSLVDDLSGSTDYILHNIYPIIWKDAYPKKIKIFLWELSHGAINTHGRLQRIMPYSHLSPSWCIMCKNGAECPSHLFVHCPFAAHFWNIILEAFGWNVTFPNTIWEILSTIIVGHPFHGSRKILWLSIIRAFFWKLWCERNDRTFRDIFSSFDYFWDLVLSTAFSWCKNMQPFINYSLSYFISNWKAFL